MTIFEALMVTIAFTSFGVSILVRSNEIIHPQANEALGWMIVFHLH